MGQDNNFILMKKHLVKVWKYQRKNTLIVLGLAVTVITLIVGKFGMAISNLRNIGTGERLSLIQKWNPFMLLYYAWIQLGFISIILLGAIVLIAAFVIANLEERNYDADRNFQISGTGTKGTGGFMKDDDIEAALYRKKIEDTTDNIIGVDPYTKLILSPKPKLYLNGHKCVCGGSGSRKTTTNVLNDFFQAIERKESIIVTDPKGEIYKLTKTMVEKKGYIVRVLNLKDTLNSDGIDFLKTIKSEDGNIDTEVLRTQTLVETIFKNTSGESDQKGFWPDLQRSLLISAILYVHLDRTQMFEHSLSGAYNMILRTAPKRLNQMFTALDDSHPAKGQYILFGRATDEIQTSAILGLTMRLNTWQGQSVQRIISEDEMDLALPGQKKCAYYIILSDQEGTMNAIASMFFAMFFIKIVAYADGKISQQCDVPVNLIMDEMPSIGTVPDFDKKLANVRSRLIRINIIFQTYAQMKEKYPDGKWETIVSQCDINIYLGGNDSESSAQYYVNRLGTMTVISKGKRTNYSSTSITGNRYHPTYMVTETETEREVMTVDELMRLDLDDCLVFLKTCRPLKAKKFVYTNHPLAKEIEPTNPLHHYPIWRRHYKNLSMDASDEVLFAAEFPERYAQEQEESKRSSNIRVYEGSDDIDPEMRQ